MFVVYISHKYLEYVFPLASRQGKWRRLTSIKDHFKQSKQLREKAIFSKLQGRVAAKSVEILKTSESLIPTEGKVRTKLDSQGWREITWGVTWPAIPPTSLACKMNWGELKIEGIREEFFLPNRSSESFSLTLACRVPHLESHLEQWLLGILHHSRIELAI